MLAWLVILLALPLLLGADATGVDAMPPWIQAGSVTAFAALVYWEVRKIRDRIDSVMDTLAGETTRRRRKRDSDQPAEAGRGPPQD